jgi:hypothetical protein
MNLKMGIAAILLIHIGVVMLGFAMYDFGGSGGPEDSQVVTQAKEVCLLTWPIPIYFGVRIWRKYKT